eukprot:SAG31_NODE_3749_length_3922_cov_1.586144_3_plen_86_part_00
MAVYTHAAQLKRARELAFLGERAEPARPTPTPTPPRSTRLYRPCEPAPPPPLEAIRTTLVTNKLAGRKLTVGCTVPQTMDRAQKL